MTDAVMLCIQPASGDSLQFMKAGIMEVPDLAVVTKADIGVPARRAAADLRTALAVGDGDALPVLLCSAQSGEGVGAVFDAFHAILERAATAPRAEQAAHWVRAALMADFGTEGWRAVASFVTKMAASQPFTEYDRCKKLLTNALVKLDFQGQSLH